MTNTALLPQQSSIWWVFLLQGFAGVILGLMLVTQPDATIVATVTLNSAVLVSVAVIAQIIRASDQSPVDGLRISVSPLMIPAVWVPCP